MTTETTTRLDLMIYEGDDGSYHLSFGVRSAVITHEDIGWLLSDGKRHANVTLLPSGEIDWHIVIQKVRKWS